MKASSTIIHSVAAIPGWIAVYYQQTAGEGRLVPASVALWVLVEREVKQEDGKDGTKSKRKGKEKVHEYRPYVAGRDGRILDISDLDDAAFQYLILASPDENWIDVGQAALNQLIAATTVASAPAPAGEAVDEAPTAAPAPEGIGLALEPLAPDTSEN